MVLHLGKLRRIILISLVIVMLAGFSTKRYEGPAAFWVQNSLSGIWYVVFWCLLLFLIVPGSSTARIAVVVFLATAVIEVLQLYRLPLPESFRSSFIGKTLLGTTFVWSDFFYYGVGCVASWIFMRHIRSRASLATEQSYRLPKDAE